MAVINLPTADFVTTTLNGAVSAGATSATIGTGLSIPATNGILQVDYDSSSAVGADNGPETWFYTAYTTGTGAVSGLTRGYAGTTDVLHANGASVQAGPSVKYWELLEDFAAFWVDPSETWVYASASTFTITGIDRTSIYQKGTKLRFKQGAGYKYAVVASSSFSTDTTVTIIVNTDYTIANAAITDNYYSYAENPQGFPSGFAYSPGGIAGSNVTVTGRYTVNGRRVSGRIMAEFTGAITFTTMPALPVQASASLLSTANLGGRTRGVGGYTDSGTADVPLGLIATFAASATLCIIAGTGGVSMSASSPITWANADALGVPFDYEF